MDIESGQYYFDAVDVTQDETEALVLAVERQQIAIFITKRIEIRINKQ